jgi:hypothetical protein
MLLECIFNENKYGSLYQDLYDLYALAQTDNLNANPRISEFLATEVFNKLYKGVAIATIQVCDTMFNLPSSIKMYHLNEYTIQQLREFITFISETATEENLTPQWIRNAAILKGMNPATVRDKVVAIDTILGMIHDSGSMLDYIDRSADILDILNTLEHANTKTLVNHSSSYIKEIVWSASHGLVHRTPTMMDKLATIIVRAAKVHEISNVRSGPDGVSLDISIFCRESEWDHKIKTSLTRLGADFEISVHVKILESGSNLLVKSAYNGYVASYTIDGLIAVSTIYNILSAVRTSVDKFIEMDLVKPQASSR